MTFNDCCILCTAAVCSCAYLETFIVKRYCLFKTFTDQSTVRILICYLVCLYVITALCV